MKIRPVAVFTLTALGMVGLQKLAERSRRRPKKKQPEPWSPPLESPQLPECRADQVLVFEDGRFLCRDVPQDPQAPDVGPSDKGPETPQDEPGAPQTWSRFYDLVYWRGKWRELPTRAQGAWACGLIVASGGFASVDENVEFFCRAHGRKLWRDD